MISAGPKLLFAPMLYASHKKRADRKYGCAARCQFVTAALTSLLLCRVREVYEEVAGPIAPGRRYIVLDLTMDDDGVDVITPQVQLFFA